MEILGKIGILFWEIRVERVWVFGVFVDWGSFGFGGLEKLGFGFGFWDKLGIGLGKDFGLA